MHTNSTEPIHTINLNDGPLLVMPETRLAFTIDTLALYVHEIAISKGWWDEGRNDGELIALMHSELSEALEALRLGNPPDDKIPGFTGVEAELADVIIRVLDYAAARKLRLGAALSAKIEMNKGRAHRHGKKF